MSFRLFTYYCALCGGWAALVGWALGRIASRTDPVADAGIKGLCLGLLVAAGLGFIDGMGQFSLRRIGALALRLLAGCAIGAVGGLIGGMVGQGLYGLRENSVFLVFGWAVTGTLVGASVGAYDLLERLRRHEEPDGAIRKIRKGAVGGLLGGGLGGTLALLLHGAWADLLTGWPAEQLWSPSAFGFVALGLCIGLLVSLVQVLFKGAWVQVEAGFRAGRELILARSETTIGRAEACDIALFGDAGVEKLHARICLAGDRYLLADAGSSGGTYLNDALVRQPTALQSGDVIRIGKGRLRFHLGKARAGRLRRGP